MACTTSMNCDPHFKSLDKMNNYPIINDSIVLALSYYQWLKSKNKMIDNTLSKAEKTLKTVKDTAEPFAVRNLGFVDNVVFNQLERLEKKCPIILEPSKAITSIPSKIYQDNIQFAVDTMMWPVTKTLDTVSKTSTMAMSTMSSMMESSVRKVFPHSEISVNATNYLIDRTDELLDKYLPGTDELLTEEIRNEDIYAKVKRLSNKTQQRLYRRASKRINIILQSSLEILEQIQSIIIDIQIRKNAMKETITKEYSNVVDVLKENIQTLQSKQYKSMNEISHHFKTLQRVISSTASSTTENLLNSTLNGLNGLNGNLFNLQKILKESKPEFLSETFLNHTNELIISIRMSLESFINNMRTILKKTFHDKEMTEMTEISHNKTD